MRALTVQQPWAWAIIHGGKDVENRTQAWSYRGPLAIHAGTRLSQRGMDSPLVRHAARAAHPDSGMFFEGEAWTITPPLAMGAIIGVVDLVDAHLAETCPDADGATCSAWAESSYVEHGAAGKDRTRRDVVHLVLERPRPLAEPIPCKGRLGLWTPPRDVVAELEPLTCQACEWVETRALFELVPTVLRGQPCQEHA